MKKYLVVAFLLVLSIQLRAEEVEKEASKKEVEINMDKVSETLGHLLIKQLSNPAISFNIDKIVDGMKAATTGKAAPLTEAEYEEQILAIQEKIFQKTSEKNLDDAMSFLEKNQKADGVITLSDKLQYKVLEQGADDSVQITNEMKPMIHYTGKLMDGTVFASSIDSKNPITLSLKETIAGFSKGLLGMKKGEKRILYIHPELAYGMASHLPPNSLLVFEVEVIETNVATAVEEATEPTVEITAPVEVTEVAPQAPVEPVSKPTAQLSHSKGRHGKKKN